MTLSEGIDIQQPEDVFQDAYKSLIQTLEQSQSPAGSASICKIPASSVLQDSMLALQSPGDCSVVSTDSTAAVLVPAVEKVEALAAPNESKAPTTPDESEAPEDKKRWFVMRDLKRANAKMPAYKQFMEAGVEIFTPMHTVRKSIDGKPQNVQEPFIRDLLFVHDTRRVIDPIVDVTPTIQYRYERGKGYKVPMVVRDAEMNRFIMAVTASKSPKFYSPEDLSASMLGRSVRITGGTLEGYVGKLLKISGSRTKRLLVQIEGILAAGIEVETRYVEML